MPARPLPSPVKLIDGKNIKGKRKRTVPWDPSPPKTTLRVTQEKQLPENRTAIGGRDVSKNRDKGGLRHRTGILKHFAPHGRGVETHSKIAGMKGEGKKSQSQYVEKNGQRGGKKNLRSVNGRGPGKKGEISEKKGGG